MEAGGPRAGAGTLAAPPGLERARASRWLLARPGRLAAALALLPVLLWLLDVAGHGLPRGGNRAMVGAVLLAAAAALAAAFVQALARGREAGADGADGDDGDKAGVLLPALLLAAALAVRFAGLDWEIGSGYYRDEGIYRATAERIDAGRLLVHSFIYGHFLHYAGAFALWLCGLFPGLAARAARLLYGISDPVQVQWLALRSVSALCGALTVLPVYGIARRVVGGSGLGLPDPADLSSRAAALALAKPGRDLGSRVASSAHGSRSDSAKSSAPPDALPSASLEAGTPARDDPPGGTRGGGAASSPAAGAAGRELVAGPSASRFAGLAAGSIAGLLIIASPLYNEVSHLLISDVPAAFFASLCLYFTARLLDGERTADYLLAGAAAGLAAGSKYPAGLAAVGIAGMWAWWRWRERRWSWSLVWAAAAAIGAMLAVMPALAVYPRAAFSGEGRDVLFGVRQYGEGGWIGVMPGSNAAWYAGQLVASFGLPALLLGLAGIAFLARRERLRLALVLPFPLAYFALLAALHMVVKRNLQPVLPALAALLGVGIAGWGALAARLAERRMKEKEGGQPAGAAGARARAALGLAGLAALAFPVWATTAQTLSMSRASTRELAVEWIRANVPRGASFVKETYTPNLDPAEYASVQRRFAARLSMEEILDPAHDYLLLAEPAYGRFLDEHNLTKPHHRLFAASYRRMLALPVVRDFRAGPTRRGPHLTLYRLDPPRIDYASARRFTPADAAFLSDPALAPRREGGPLRFSAPGQFALFKGYFAAGRYRVTVTGPPAPAGATRLSGAPGPSARPRQLGSPEVSPAPESASSPGPAAPPGSPLAAGGTLAVRTREGRGIARVPFAGGTAAFTLREPAKLFLYVSLSPGSRLRTLAVLPAGSGAASTARPGGGPGGAGDTQIPAAPAGSAPR